MDYENRCCFSGHRPERLPWRYGEQHPDCLALKHRLTLAICAQYDKGKRHFISGMAQGTDLYFAEAVLHLQQQYTDILLECARPYQAQAEAWSKKEQERYHRILAQCNLETLVQHHYTPDCLQRRNRYMVEHASALIAIYDGTPKGGTANTIAYAIKQGLKVEILPVLEGNAL